MERTLIEIAIQGYAADDVYLPLDLLSWSMGNSNPDSRICSGFGLRFSFVAFWERWEIKLMGGFQRKEFVHS